MKYDQFPAGTEATTKIRYRDQGTLSKLFPTDQQQEVYVEFLAHVKGVAPGQSAVFYEGHDVLGGGIIKSGMSN